MSGKTASLATMLYAALIWLAGCSSQTAPAMLTNMEDETSVLLFSKEENLYEEKPYYQALLHLNKQCENEAMNMKIVSANNNDLVQYLGVKTFPSLYVMEGKNMLSVYEGKAESANIETFLKKHIRCE
ncbi:hypothetical protein [Alteribacillus sp. YIM 98480]|uniref:hypothetical protein n=1 Tax=Alteribacillus sp. YIM 98480 TaxID=2606599 RepID=UPI00131B54DC|nr:hypothetical protein [Alteribacillus sp. YIM 98480]